MLIRRGKRAVAEADEAPEYWITYSDLMVSVLMTFALLLFLALARVQAEVRKASAIVDAGKQAIQAAGQSLTGAVGRVAFDSASGTLTLPADVVFAFGSSQLSADGEAQIDQIATRFLPKLLSQPAVDTVVQEIVIEGHTDTVGTYLTNLILSQDRAAAVMRQIVTDTEDSTYGPRLQQLIAASGKSEVRPIYDASGHINAAKSRRIEIHIRFRDDAILKRVLEATRAHTAPKP
jgi:chemotaxis protein MotB